MAEIIITDMLGREAAYYKGLRGQYEIPLNINNISKGSYVAELRINNAIKARRKLVIN